MGLICPECKNTLSGSGDKFCYLCGTEMVQRKPCSCGKVLDKHDKFCPACGKKVEA